MIARWLLVYMDGWEWIEDAENKKSEHEQPSEDKSEKEAETQNSDITKAQDQAETDTQMETELETQSIKEIDPSNKEEPEKQFQSDDKSNSVPNGSGEANEVDEQGK